MEVLNIYTYILPSSSVPDYPHNLAYYPKWCQNASLKKTDSLLCESSIQNWTWWHRPIIPGTQEAETEGSQVHDPSGLWSEFKTRLDNLVRPCLKMKRRLEI